MKRLSIIIFFVFTTIVAVWAQQEIFQGMVVDSATFSALPYVNIRIKGTNRGTSADANGKFAIQATRKDTLLISLVGYDSLIIPLYDWETSVVRMTENITMLQTITIRSTSLDPYQGMFDEQNTIRDNRKNKFYFSRERKEKNKISWLLQDNLMAKTYVDLIINNPETKTNLMKQYHLTEDQYYKTLERFNEKNYRVMYYLTAGELLTLVNNFFARDHAN